MCNPALAGAAMIAGTITSAAGQLQAGLYASRMARYESQVAQQNKARVREQAVDALGRGQDQQQQLGRDVAARIGAQTARMAGNNVDITFGSAARLIDDTALLGREDSEALAENIRRQVAGYQSDAWNFESESRSALAEARQAKTASAMSAMTTLLGGAVQYQKFREGRGK